MTRDDLEATRRIDARNTELSAERSLTPVQREASTLFAALRDLLDATPLPARTEQQRKAIWDAGELLTRIRDAQIADMRTALDAARARINPHA